MYGDAERRYLAQEREEHINRSLKSAISKAENDLGRSLTSAEKAIASGIFRAGRECDQSFVPTVTVPKLGH